MTAPRLVPSLVAVGLLLLGGCAGQPDGLETAVPHGYVEGATETPEPQLHLVVVTAAGEVRLHDLITGAESAVAEVEGVRALSTDGRYAFAAADDTLTILDSGVWTVDHEDHFHYYRADPRVVGTLRIHGVAEVVSGSVHTAVTAGGESVILDTASLGEGSIREIVRLDADAVVPYAGALLVARGGSAELIDVEGRTLAEGRPCDAPAGTLLTGAGAGVGCAGGAVLATASGSLDWIPYPVGSADAATEFRNRAGRPTTAAVAGSTGAWLLDTREQTWRAIATDTPLLQASAADDREEHVVAVAADGSILVIDGRTGATLGRTAALLSDPRARGTGLTVGTSRAYVNDPAAGIVYEIDYADSARISRELAVEGGAAFMVVTGR